jgi:hypothetical protein
MKMKRFEALEVAILQLAATLEEVIRAADGSIPVNAFQYFEISNKCHKLIQLQEENLVRNIYFIIGISCGLPFSAFVKKVTF